MRHKGKAKLRGIRSGRHAVKRVKRRARRIHLRITRSRPRRLRLNPRALYIIVSWWVSFMFCAVMAWMLHFYLGWMWSWLAMALATGSLALVVNLPPKGRHHSDGF